MAFGDSVFMRLKALLEADTDGLHRGFAEARRDAAETANYIDRQKGTVEIDAKIAEFERKADYVEARMKEIDALDAEPEVKLKATRELERQAQSIERSLSRLNDQRALQQLGGDAHGAARGMRDFHEETDRTRRSGDRTIPMFGKMGKSLSDIRIQLGFASLNVKQLGAAMVFLSPILSALLGTASAMIGTLGSGIAGAAAIGGAGLSGLALGALGLVGALAGADKRMKAMQKDWSGLLKDFQGQTGPARDSFFDLMADGLERAQSLMPMFAQETNKFAQGLQAAGKNFLSAFDEGEMRSTISTIMSAFSGSLPQLGSALGNIAEAFGNIFASASRYIQPVTDAIADWAQGFSDATSNSSKLDSVIDGMADSAESLIHFLAAAGRLMVTFFGSGADEGRGLFDDMTAGLNEWNEALKTQEGQAGLNDWFADSIGTVKQLFGLLESGVGILGEFARAFEPISDGAMAVLRIIGDLVHMLMDVPGGSLLLTALGGAAGLSMAANLVMKIVNGLKLLGASSILGGLLGGGRAAAGGGLLGGLFGGTGGLAMLTRFTGVAGLMVGSIYAITKALGWQETEGTRLSEVWDRNVETMQRFRDMAASAVPVLRTNRGGINSLRQGMSDLIPQLREGGDAGHDAFIGFKTSLQESRGPLVEQQKGIREWRQSLETANNSIRNFNAGWAGNPVWESALKSMRATGEVTDSTRRKLLALGATREQIDLLEESFGDMGEVIDRTSRQTAALDKQLIAATRAQKGMSQLSLGTDAIQRMSNLVGRQNTLKFLMDVDTSKAAQKIAALVSQVSRMGGRRQAMEIIANTDGAQAKLRALEQLKQRAANPVKFAISAADRGASATAKAVKGLVDAIPKKHDTDIRGRDNASGPAKSATGAINAVPQSHDTQIRGDASQAIATARAAAAAISGMTAVLHVVAAVSGMPSGGRAQGGPLVPERGEIPGYASGGGYIRRPVFMVGEEAPQHPEFVIATNPAYRKDNVKYLFQAAHALGIPGFAQGGVPKPYRVGAIPVGRAQHDYDDARQKYQKSRDYLKKLQDKLDEKGRKGDPSNSSMRSARAQAHADHEAMKVAQRNLRAVKAANKQIDTIGKEISLDSSQMALWQEKGNSRRFDKWKGEKISDINSLLHHLQRQARFAHGGFKTEILDRIAQLRAEKATTQRETPGANALLTGDETGDLNAVNADIALARLTTDQADDIAANQKLQAFWQGVLNRLKNQNAGPELIAQAANNLADAQQTFADTGGGSGTVSTIDTYNTARADLYRAFGGNAIMGNQLVTSSPFAAAPGAAGTTVVQDISFQTAPSDPHSWANAAAWEAQAAMA